MSNHDYLQRFQTLVNVATSYTGQLHDQAIVHIVTEQHHPNIAYTTLTNPQKQAVQTASSELYLATMFIHQSDRSRCGKLSKDLKNSFTKGNDDYPENLVFAYHLINKFKCWQPKQESVPDSSGVTLAQTKGKGKVKGDTKAEDDSWQKKATCHHCSEVGRICHNCPKLKDDEETQDDDEANTSNKNLKDRQTKSQEEDNFRPRCCHR
jgi:hypothetical protein